MLVRLSVGIRIHAIVVILHVVVILVFVVILIVVIGLMLVVVRLVVSSIGLVLVVIFVVLVIPIGLVADVRVDLRGLVRFVLVVDLLVGGRVLGIVVDDGLGRHVL